MAQRRMFSPDIVCSDAFLDMPASCRDLYYQLGMYADDDGFVNPRKIMRMLGSSEDDLKILISKRFLFPFKSGVVVIKHWKINNLVRKDWYRPTQYIEERSQLFIKENGSYTDDSTQGMPFVNDSLTIRQHRLGKVSIGNTKEGASATTLKKLITLVKENPDVLKEPIGMFQKKIEYKMPEYKRLIVELASHDYLSASRLHSIVTEQFLPHWLEKGEGAKKARWQKEKNFDYQLRIRTWIRNYHKFEKDVQCRSRNWHRKGETCHCEPKVELPPKVRSQERETAVKRIAESKKIQP